MRRFVAVLRVGRARLIWKINRRGRFRIVGWVHTPVTLVDIPIPRVRRFTLGQDLPIR